MGSVQVKVVLLSHFRVWQKKTLMWVYLTRGFSVSCEFNVGDHLRGVGGYCYTVSVDPRAVVQPCSSRSRGSCATTRSRQALRLDQKDEVELTEIGSCANWDGSKQAHDSQHHVFKTAVNITWRNYYFGSFKAANFWIRMGLWSVLLWNSKKLGGEPASASYFAVSKKGIRGWPTAHCLEVYTDMSCT